MATYLTVKGVQEFKEDFQHLSDLEVMVTLDSLFKNMDWSYDYSGDHRVYKAGQEQETLIQGIVSYTLIHREHLTEEILESKKKWLALYV